MPQATGLATQPSTTGSGPPRSWELARAFARAPRTQRSLLSIGCTSEEDGLLGACQYAENPVRPLETTAAVFNLDPHLALSQTRSVELIGAGRSPLEHDLARLAAAQGRVIEAKADLSAGWYTVRTIMHSPRQTYPPSTVARDAIW